MAYRDYCKKCRRRTEHDEPNKNTPHLTKCLDCGTPYRLSKCTQCGRDKTNTLPLCLQCYTANKNKKGSFIQRLSFLRLPVKTEKKWRYHSRGGTPEYVRNLTNKLKKVYGADNVKTQELKTGYGGTATYIYVRR